MKPDARSQPPALSHLLGRLPAYPGALLLAQALNLTLAKHLDADVIQRLRGRKLRLHVTDTAWRLDFVWRGGRFVACAPQAQVDLALSAKLQDFARLARRQDDPDTLFFNRRLTMEGDTELGLLIKNTLDALEAPVFDPQTWHPAAVLRAAGQRLQSWLARPPGAAPRSAP
ncbi:MAG: SCP2 sterol-binding domain-containing protein [Rhodoferax sp.]